MRIAICESDKQQAERLSDLIFGWKEQRKSIVEVQIFLSAEQFLFAVSGKKSFEVAFLDTDMKRIRGIDLAKYIRKENEQILLIFTTNEARFAIEGYGVSAFRF